MPDDTEMNPVSEESSVVEFGDRATPLSENPTSNEAEGGTMNTTIQSPTATLTVRRQVWLELQALIHSIAFMQALPDDHQMPADLRDACALARSMASPALASLVLDVKKRTGIVIDLWPDNLSLTAKEQHERKAFLQTFAIMMDEYQRALSDFAARNPLHGGEAA